jgi:hypothetical protein
MSILRLRHVQDVSEGASMYLVPFIEELSRIEQSDHSIPRPRKDYVNGCWISHSTAHEVLEGKHGTPLFHLEAN